MRTAMGARRLTSRDDGIERRWRFGFFIVYSCALLIAFAVFAQQPTAKPSILPTGPMPGVNVP